MRNRFVILSEAIAKTNDLHNAMAQEIRQAADVWSLLTLGFAVCILALLFWRFDRTRQVAQLAIAEQKILGESEKRFRSLFEDSPISLWEEDFSLVTT